MVSTPSNNFINEDLDGNPLENKMNLKTPKSGSKNSLIVNPASQIVITDNGYNEPQQDKNNLVDPRTHSKNNSMVNTVFDNTPSNDVKNKNLDVKGGYSTVFEVFDQGPGKTKQVMKILKILMCRSFSQI